MKGLCLKQYKWVHSFSVFSNTNSFNFVFINHFFETGSCVQQKVFTCNDFSMAVMKQKDSCHYQNYIILNVHVLSKLSFSLNEDVELK